MEINLNLNITKPIELPDWRNPLLPQGSDTMKDKEFHDGYKLNIYKDGSVELLNGSDDVMASKPPFDEVENDPDHPGKISNLNDFVDELDIILTNELDYMKRHAQG